ncbi:MAG: DUF3089 domain-containing protein [Desulfobacterales bacterium]
MGGFLKVCGGLIAILVAVGAGIYFTGNTFNVLLATLKPHHGFDLSRKGPAPDYADSANWAALPEKGDPADLVPEGVTPRKGEAPVDVFFIHPTGYLRGADWNWAMDPDTATDENTQWMMANQASAFNSCCNVYAPRYRQASIFAYLVGYDTKMAQKALGFAYQDVERAFDHFLASREPGRPFIIAGHSQGTHHATTLLKKRIAGTPLRDQMVAAYTIGGWIKHRDIVEMKDIEACDGPLDLHCVNHWVTWGEGGDPGEFELIQGGATICTNPLTWKLDGGRAEAALSKGAVASIGTYNPGIFGKDEASGQSFGPLGKPLVGYTWAECRDGNLFVENQTEGQLGQSILMPGTNNYHGIDYQLFHMDIRENATERAAAWLAAMQTGHPQ